MARLLDRILGTTPTVARSEVVNLADPAAAYLFGAAPVDSGEFVGERSALSTTAFYRAVAIKAGTVATLPLRTFEMEGELPSPVASWVDDPGFVTGRTPHEWKALVMTFLGVHGEVFLDMIQTADGVIVGAEPIHPHCVEVEREPKGYGRRYKIMQRDGTYTDWLGPDRIAHVVDVSADGLRGLSPLTVGRNALGTYLAGERAAGRMFRNGLMMGGIVTPDPQGLDEWDEGDAETIKADIAARGGGVDNVGSVLFVNRALNLTPWAMTADQAQFIESRAFQIEEVSRLTGVPPHLLSQTEKQTSWGQGVGEQNRGLARYTLMPSTSAVQDTLSRYQPVGRWVEFDYHALMQGTPNEEIELVVKQVTAGLLTRDEARAKMQLGPWPEGAEAAVPAYNAVPDETVAS